MICFHKLESGFLVEFIVVGEIIQNGDKIYECFHTLYLVIPKHFVIYIVSVFSENQHQLFLKTRVSNYILFYAKRVHISLAPNLNAIEDILQSLIQVFIFREVHRTSNRKIINNFVRVPCTCQF